MSVGIVAIRHVLPGKPIDIGVGATMNGIDPDFARNKLGIRSRHIAADNVYVSDLATAAGELLLEETGTAREDIGLLVIVTQTPDYNLPHTSALVQHQLRLPQAVAAFDVSLGCSGYVYGLSIAASLMTAQGIDRGILITADTYSKIVSPTDHNTAALFGDAATATLLGPDPVYTLGGFTFGTDGSRAEMLIARSSGLRDDKIQPLEMDGRGIFAFAMAEVPSNVDSCLDANNLSRDDIDAWVFHQANRYMLVSLAARMGIADDKLLVDMEDTANTTSSTIPIVLQRRLLTAQKRPRHALLSGFGVGLSLASTVITSCKE